MSATQGHEARTERLLAFTFIGDLPLALDGAGIVSIETPDDDEQGVDVFALFDVPCALLKSERRLARLSGDGEGARALLLGDRVELGAVRAADVLPAPPFLAGLGSRSGLLGFVRFAGKLFCLFDPARVTRPGIAAS